MPESEPGPSAGLIEADASDEERETTPTGPAADSDDAEPDDEYMAKFVNKKSLEEEMAEFDSDDEPDEAAIAAAMATTRGGERPQYSHPPSGSDLTSLPPSEPAQPPSTALTLPASRSTAERQAGATDAELLKAMEETLPPRSRAVLTNDSEEEEDGLFGGKQGRTKPSRRVADSDDEDAQARAEEPTLSTKERLQALALKRAPPPTKEKSVPLREERSLSAIETDSEDGKRAQAKQKRKVRSAPGLLRTSTFIAPLLTLPSTCLRCRASCPRRARLK